MGSSRNKSLGILIVRWPVFSQVVCDSAYVGRETSCWIFP